MRSRVVGSPQPTLRPQRRRGETRVADPHCDDRHPSVATEDAQKAHPVTESKAEPRRRPDGVAPPPRGELAPSPIEKRERREDGDEPRHHREGPARNERDAESDPGVDPRTPGTEPD